MFPVCWPFPSSLPEFVLHLIQWETLIFKANLHLRIYSPEGTEEGGKGEAKEISWEVMDAGGTRGRADKLGWTNNLFSAVSSLSTEEWEESKYQAFVLCHDGWQHAGLHLYILYSATKKLDYL